MHNLKKHTIAHHKDKYVKSPVRKLPKTQPKTNIKICISNNKKFKEQVTAEREEMNVKIVTIRAPENLKFAGN